MALDPADHTVSELKDALADLDDADELEGVLGAEREGKDRKTAVAAIESRLAAVGDGDDETAGGSGAVLAGQEPSDEALEIEELSHPTADKRHVRGLVDGDYRDMWVYCETQRGELIDVSKEMLGKARELMDTYNDDFDEDEKVVAVVIGGDGTEALAEEAIEYGADVAVYAADDRLERVLVKPYTEIFCDVARGAGHPLAREDAPDYDWHGYDEPRYTVFPATNNGRDLSATVQAELDSGLASDCSDLYIEPELVSNPVKTGTPGEKVEFERTFHMKRPDFSGFEYSTILCIDKPERDFHPQGASVIPGSFDLPEPDPERTGEVIEHELTLDEDWFDVTVTETDLLEGGVDLTGHEVVVALGRGISRDPTKGIELGLDLVDAFDDAALGLSRGVITASYDFDGHVEQYVTEERQIGESGQVVKPPLYIAAGISGAVQHKVGMDEAETIVAINTEPDADIKDFSDYYIQGDLFELLPRFAEALEAGELDLAAVADGGVSDD
ncbi:MAG: electron transfer flavoprotein subunit alpha/FixB family protein [Halobacteriales archaeon]|nr:electron transfer flavoprotein subunit alpha/FixB family protein [Halobacteriales archaeon]